VEQVAARSIMNLLFGVALLTSGCRDRALPIPSSISDEEYSVYSAWIKHHFIEQPPRLLLSRHTFIFDPLSSQGCNPKELEAQAEVSLSLLRSLHTLGEAEYPLRTDKFQQREFKIPWKYEESEGLPTADPSRPFRLIAFSRVAFNRDRSKAFFAVSNSCGGLCGGGGPLVAIRKEREWAFRPELGCYWVY